ncbi:hypothetical protein O181_060975 [Austropuccinia psidii MF-1]|uniref:Uncharacterized protein n=1 Tax=Austropuccinia psidii MF-1 TaxID=1389203 RepID=A0A9Q3I028_9BASI|nr:hypothetical protein [Austropuccinia psidii MF-1]
MDFFHQHFAQISWLKIGNDKLEGLFIQSVPVVSPGLSQPAFNQLLTTQIFGAGGGSCRFHNETQKFAFSSPFSNTQSHPSPPPNNWLHLTNGIGLLKPLLRTLGLCAKTAGRKGIGGKIVCGHQQESATHPHLALILKHLCAPDVLQALNKSVIQVKLIEHTLSEKVLEDSGASLHHTGASAFASHFCTTPPFTIFLNPNLTDGNS